jgi:hypothetical protein
MTQEKLKFGDQKDMAELAEMANNLNMNKNTSSPTKVPDQTQILAFSKKHS